MEIHIATQYEMAKVFELRTEVFVNEQKVPAEIEIDEEDKTAVHIIATDKNIAIGCARIVFSKNDAHIGRLAVKKAYRGKNIGFQICKFIIKYCKENGYSNIWLNSQLHASEFYEKLNFIPQGEVFTEAGIEHIKMVLNSSPVS